MGFPGYPVKLPERSRLQGLPAGQAPGPVQAVGRQCVM